MIVSSFNPIKYFAFSLHSYRINEESIEVIDETIKQEEAVNNQNDSKSGGSPTGNGNDKPLTMEYNPDLQSRDYNRDEDVLSYLRYGSLSFSKALVVIKLYQHYGTPTY